MRSALRIAVVVTVLAVPAVALAAGNSRPYAVNCNREQYKPRQIVLACGDAGIGLDHLKWSHWSRTKAVATGTYYENTCTPTCVSGHTVTRPVKVTLVGLGTCPGHSHPVFTVARFRFPHGVPPHPYRSFSFGCPY
jgi:hypothetical protein